MVQRLKQVTRIQKVLFFFNIYLFWLHQVLVAARGIFVAACLVAICGLLSCGMQTLSCSMHVGSSSLTRDQTWAPCIGNMGVSPTGPQGMSQKVLFLAICLNYLCNLELVT